jgi:dTDP-glucose pyrophosphorylase
VELEGRLDGKPMKIHPLNEKQHMPRSTWLVTSLGWCDEEIVSTASRLRFHLRRAEEITEKLTMCS